MMSMVQGKLVFLGKPQAYAHIFGKAHISGKDEYDGHNKVMVMIIIAMVVGGGGGGDTDGSNGGGVVGHDVGG
ncbi:hypothetical protein VNO77_02203 [Canavalia gladiata]|uniref:Uncharacterized protein n=1 Tax=Canavalia gladiata TaxID=3824 RepID=A0AAN9MUL4_CANGL